MTRKLKTQKFNVEVRIVVITSQSVLADSFEVALAKAKDMKVGDFIEVLGEHNDSSILISSVSADGTWRTDDYA